MQISSEQWSQMGRDSFVRRMLVIIRLHHPEKSASLRAGTLACHPDSTSRIEDAMALKDYSDEPDFYDQGFEHKGWVSVWLGTTPAPTGGNIDTLQDLCGVGYYELSDQESHNSSSAVPVGQLFEKISYAATFLTAVLAAAQRMDIATAFWMTAQFDFAYDKSKVRRPISEQPVFIGAFRFSADE